MTPRRLGEGALRTHRERHRCTRARRRAAVAGGALALALGVSACAGRNGVDLAQQACSHVKRSLTLYRASTHATDPQQAGAEQDAALAQLHDAEPLAATAAGEAGQFQGLMSTLAESDHLPESYLVTALTAQCAAADAGNPFVPVTPPTSTVTTAPAPNV
jgi:hypothetical protein